MIFFIAFPAVVCLFANTLVEATEAQNATAFALLYGYPLLGWQKLALRITTYWAVNTPFHNRQLSTPNDTKVVAPNADTVYTAIAYDLSEEDLNIGVPDIPDDQYHLFSYYDPFGNNYANTGSGSGNLDHPGQYILRPTPPRKKDGVDEEMDVDTAPGQVHINSPSFYGVLLVRLLVNQTNLDTIHLWQDELKVVKVNRLDVSQPRNVPALLDTMNSIGNSSYDLETQVGGPLNTAQTVLTLLAAYAPWCRPENEEKDFSQTFVDISPLLSDAGVGNLGYYKPQPSVNLRKANDTANARAAKALLAQGVTKDLGNGWSVIASEYTGDFGQHYDVRALVADKGYLMLKAPNAVYPTWNNGSDESFTNTSVQWGTALHI